MTSPTTPPPDSPRPSPSGAAVDRWCGFWFTPRPAHPLGLVRIAFGFVVVTWTLALLPELSGVFGREGAVPQYALLDHQWSVFELWPGETALLIGWVLLLLAAIALAAGWHGRVAAIVLYVLLHSFVRRGVYVFNAGDTILVVVALILALSSCSAALSLDQRRRSGSFWTAQTRAPWPLRLMQLLLTLIYLVSVQAKLAGRFWDDGSAVFYAWATDGRWALLAPPAWVSTNAIIVNAITWATLAIELAIAVLVWNRRWRPKVLAVGVLMHLTMMLTMNVGFFSLAMFVLYLAFVPWEAVKALPDKLRNPRRDRTTTPPTAD